MYHNILIQKDYPDYSKIKKIVKLLLEFIETDSIYFSRHLEGEVNIGIITVIVSEDNQDSYDDIYDHARKIFKSHPEFSFRVYSADWVVMQLNEGNTFFIMHCSEHELVYSVDESSSVISLKKFDAKWLIKKSEKRFRLYFNESNIIGRDLRFHLGSENHLMAAYTMHEQLCSLFVSASWFLTGNAVAHDDIGKLQEDLSKFSNILGKTFDPDKEEEWIVLEQLVDARAAIQFNAEIEPISKETVEVASAKVDWVEKEVRRLFEGYIKKTKQKIKDYGNR
ncbi:hypothetical protein [Flavobacterium sp. ZS1P14]|uniref:hypothetical protein n=1 Tax=Flavobacterium sp. ZS1P14 TaxID=3401729 RepID=UPI003AAAD6E4